MESLGHRCSIFSFLRNLCAASHSGRPASHSHQQCTGAPLSPHSYRHLLLRFLSVTVILTGVRWHHTVVMSSIFPCTCWPSVCRLWRTGHSSHLLIFTLSSLLVVVVCCSGSPVRVVGTDPLSGTWSAALCPALWAAPHPGPLCPHGLGWCSPSCRSCFCCFMLLKCPRCTIDLQSQCHPFQNSNSIFVQK